MSGFEVYLWTRLDSIRSFIEGLTFLFMLFLAAAILFYIWAKLDYREHSDYYKRNSDESYLSLAKKVYFSLLIPTIIFSLGTTLIPTKADVATIYVLPKVANSEIIKQIPEDLNDIYSLGIKEIKKSIGGTIEPIKETTKTEQPDKN